MRGWGGLGIGALMSIGFLADVAAQTQTVPAPTPPPAPPVLARVETSYFDNWTVTCREFANNQPRRACALQVQIVNNNNVVFVWNIAPEAENRWVGTMQTPTGVNITAGLELRVGRANPRRLAFVACETGRCDATHPADDAFVRDANTAENSEVTITATNGNTVRFTVPMRGFERANQHARR